MELRDIEIFLTLADELHFGRTAQRLHVTQARVSQAIKRQERSIGGPLFDRSTRRNVRLTSLGRQLRDDLQPIYAGLRDTLERAKLTAQGKTARLRLGMIPSNTHDLRPFWEAFCRRHPDCELQIRDNPGTEAFEPLRNGEIDLLVSWFPVEEPDLTVGPVIFTEPRFLTVPTDHALADGGPVSMEALDDYPGADGAGTAQPDYWEDDFTPFGTPSGRTIARSPRIAGLDATPTVIGCRKAIDSLGAHLTHHHTVYLPIHDAPPMRWVLVWRTEAVTDLIRGFAQVVRDLAIPHP